MEVWGRAVKSEKWQEKKKNNGLREGERGGGKGEETVEKVGETGLCFIELSSRTPSQPASERVSAVGEGSFERLGYQTATATEEEARIALYTC